MAPVARTALALVAVTCTLLVVACSGAKTSTSITVPSTTTTMASGPPTTLEPEAGVGRTFFSYTPVQGDCVDLRSVATGTAVTTRATPGADGSIRSDKDVILRLPCDVPHQYDVIGAVPAGLPTQAPPTNEQMVAMAKKLCPASFTTWVGLPYPQSSLEVGWILPTDDQRNRGSQTIGCTAFDPKGKLTASVRDAKR